MKKIKVKIIGHYNRYLIFIKNSIIKEIRKFHISAEVKKELISLISLNFIFSTNKKISVFGRYLILLILALFSYLFYLSTPALYDYGLLQKDLTKKLLKEFNLNSALSANINYKILPSPNFEISNVLLNTNSNNKFEDYAQIKKMKIYVYVKNLHNQNKLNIKNIVISEANFNINKNSYNYINSYFKKKISNKKIQIKKSKIFFRENNSKKNVVTLSTINKAMLLYNQKNNSNKMIIEGSIYNTKYNLTLLRNLYKKDTTDLKIEFKKLNAIIKNTFSKDQNIESNYNGKTSINFSGTKINSSYKIVDRLISLQSENSILNNKNIEFKGEINTSPFYYNIDVNLDNINAIKLIKNLSNLENLVDEKILLNKNLNGKIVFNINSLKGTKFFDKAIINLNIINGKLVLNNSVLISNKIGKMFFKDSVIEIIDNKKIFKSKILFKISNEKKFYQELQISKNVRIKLNDIYFELEKDLNIDQIDIYKLILNKEVAKASSYKTKDLTNFVDINKINQLRNWIEVKKFSNEMFSEINKAN